MARTKIKFLHKANCSTCRKARTLLESNGANLDMRDLGKDPLSIAELDQLIGKRDYLTFLSSRNELYRRKKMSSNPPSRFEALELMAAEPNLIRRPVTLRGNEIVVGYHEDALKHLSS